MFERISQVRFATGRDFKVRFSLRTSFPYTSVDMAAEHILGKFALGAKCANGDRLVSFASANRLVVSSCRFQLPQSHYVPWFSNDGRTRNQIHHRLVRSRWASSVMDCWVNIGAQTDSEHGLGHARLPLPERAARISNRPTKPDTAKLNEEVADIPQAHLRKHTVAVGTGCQLKRLRWPSKRAW